MEQRKCLVVEVDGITDVPLKRYCLTDLYGPREKRLAKQTPATIATGSVHTASCAQRIQREEPIGGYCDTTFITRHGVADGKCNRKDTKGNWPTTLQSVDTVLTERGCTQTRNERPFSCEQALRQRWLTNMTFE